MQNMFNGNRKVLAEHQFTNITTRYAAQDGLLDTWRTSRLMHDIARNLEVQEVIRDMHCERDECELPLPWTTKNWIVGSMIQPHSDAIYHDSLPTRGLLIGAWIALEDVHPEAGPLVVFPGSHRDGLWDFADVGVVAANKGAATMAAPGGGIATGNLTWAKFRKSHIHMPYQLNGSAPEAFRLYTQRLHDILAQRKMEPVPVPALLKRGEVLMWSAGVVHGGGLVRNFSRTRKSITTHYFLPGVGEVWDPLKSTKAGRYVRNTWNHFVPKLDRSSPAPPSPATHRR